MKLSSFLIIIILSFQYTLPAQSRWVHYYHDENDVLLCYFIETYDHGYLLTGDFNPQYAKYQWLIKTDINGEIIWEQTIGDGIHPISLLGLEQDTLGNNYLCGVFDVIDPAGDPFLIKIDACGEKQWCKIFYTENNDDFASDLTITPNGNVVMILTQTNPDVLIDAICIAKLSPEGELIWRQCYNTSDTNQRNEITREIICTPDQGFLVTGFCYYQDPTIPDRWIPHPYLLKVDSSGNFEWETVIFKETNLDGGAAWNTVVSPEGNYYYSSISHYMYDDSQAAPALAKLDLNGNVIGVYDITSGYKRGVLLMAQFLNDTIICASANWGMTDETSRPRAVILDTLGNLLNSKILVQDIWTSLLQLTFDGKLLYGNYILENNQYHCFLTKLNQNLEDDTIYTRPFTYDSLCPYQIVSDTIVPDDCGLIVGIEEEDKTGGREDGKTREFEIWPNPASGVIHGRFYMDDGRFNRDLTIFIYDIFGREVFRMIIPDGRETFELNLSDYPPGVYIAILKKGYNFVGSRKFVVAR